MVLLFPGYSSPPGLSSLFFYSPLLLLVIVGSSSVRLFFFFEVFFEVIFNTSVFSGCVFALGCQRVSLCEGTEL